MPNLAKDFHRLYKRIDKLTDGQASLSDIRWDASTLDSFVVLFRLKSGYYRGGAFTFEIRNLKEYNNDTIPDVICKSKIYHPNIDPTMETYRPGESNVCLNFLNNRICVCLEGLVLGILFLLHNPNFDDPLSPLFSSSDNHENFDEIAQSWINGEIVDDLEYGSEIVLCEEQDDDNSVHPGTDEEIQDANVPRTIENDVLSTNDKIGAFVCLESAECIKDENPDDILPVLITIDGEICLSCTDKETLFETGSNTRNTLQNVEHAAAENMDECETNFVNTTVQPDNLINVSGSGNITPEDLTLEMKQPQCKNSDNGEIVTNTNTQFEDVAYIVPELKENEDSDQFLGQGNHSVVAHNDVKVADNNSQSENQENGYGGINEANDVDKQAIEQLLYDDKERQVKDYNLSKNSCNPFMEVVACFSSISVLLICHWFFKRKVT